MSSDQLMFVAEAETALMYCHQDNYHEQKHGLECMMFILEVLHFV